MYTTVSLYTQTAVETLTSVLDKSLGVSAWWGMYNMLQLVGGAKLKEKDHHLVLVGIMRSVPLQSLVIVWLSKTEE